MSKFTRAKSAVEISSGFIHVFYPVRLVLCLERGHSQKTYLNQPCIDGFMKCSKHHGAEWQSTLIIYVKCKF